MYTEILPEQLKKTLFQFRIGTYTCILPVNNRKQLDVSRSKRICRICDEGVISDEIHFLFECPKLEHIILTICLVFICFFGITLFLLVLTFFNG